MKMRKSLVVMGAALVAVMGASPASARIFQYTSNSPGDTLTINTLTGRGSLGNSNADITFTSNDIYSFTGGFPKNYSFVLTSVGGNLGVLGEIVNTNLADVGGGPPRISLEINSAGDNYITIRGLQFSKYINHNININNYDWLQWGWGLVTAYITQAQGGY